MTVLIRPTKSREIEKMPATASPGLCRFLQPAAPRPTLLDQARRDQASLDLIDQSRQVCQSCWTCVMSGGRTNERTMPIMRSTNVQARMAAHRGFAELLPAFDAAHERAESDGEEHAHVKNEQHARCSWYKTQHSRRAAMSAAAARPMICGGS